MDDIFYSEEKLKGLRKSVEPYHTQKRFGHVLAVEKKADELGKLYLPEKRLKLRAAALLHDLTKKLEYEEQLKICKRFDIILSGYELISPKIFHAQTAAAMISELFPDFADEEIVSAVRWHTTGHDGMTLFESLIYLADYIEETRTFDGCIKLREYFESELNKAEGEDGKILALDRTMCYSFDLTLEDLIGDGMFIDENTIAARNYYLEKIRNAG